MDVTLICCYVALAVLGIGARLGHDAIGFLRGSVLVFVLA